MNKLITLLCIAVCDVLLIVDMINAKVLLCQSPLKWTVDNGTDPMLNSFGNVTLVTLISADHRFGQQQAQSMDNMLQFLTSTGLKEFQFIIINSKDVNARNKFSELSTRVSFPVYQETDEELVWDVIDGGKDDMFIYDRCGLLTYYIPFPLSIIHAQQPILQAALLSTYFDNPCGESCDELILDSDTTTTTTSTLEPIDSTTDSRTDSASVNDTTANDTVLEGLQGLRDLEPTFNISTPSDFKLYQVFLDRRNQSSGDSTAPEVEVDGSGSGDSDDSGLEYNATIVESIILNNTLTNDSLSQQNESSAQNGSSQESTSSMFVDLPWKIFSFFADKKNRSDEEIYNEIYNASKSEFISIAVDVETQTKSDNLTTTTIAPTTTSTATTSTTAATTTSTTTATITENIVRQTSTTAKLSTMLSLLNTTAKPTRPSFFASAARAKCDDFKPEMCYEWSTDKLLRARLCCLSTEMLGSDEDSGFGCRLFDKNKCNRMLPLIKCCLKDFSQLIETYFKSIPRSRPRMRRPDAIIS